MNRAQRIAHQLGMPQGTAQNKLRKSLLFKYIVRAGDNYCHKCGEEIESSDDMSIEHILPWENRDPDLFWNLGNISFSHKKCNTTHHRPGPPRTTGHGSDSEYNRGCRCSECRYYKSQKNKKRVR